MAMNVIIKYLRKLSDLTIGRCCSSYGCWNAAGPEE